MTLTVTTTVVTVRLHDREREKYDMPMMEVPETNGLLVGCLNIYYIINSWEGPNCPPSPRPEWYDRLSYQLATSRNGA